MIKDVINEYWKKYRAKVRFLRHSGFHNFYWQTKTIYKYKLFVFNQLGSKLVEHVSTYAIMFKFL